MMLGLLGWTGSRFSPSDGDAFALQGRSLLCDALDCKEFRYNHLFIVEDSR